MPDYVQSPEESSLRDSIKKLEAARFVWRLLAIVCVVFWVLSHLGPEVNYVFHIYDPQIEITKSQWFHKDKTVCVTWRKDSQGEAGWCAQDKDGRWYRFINDAGL